MSTTAPEIRCVDCGRGPMWTWVDAGYGPLCAKCYKDPQEAGLPGFKPLDPDAKPEHWCSYDPGLQDRTMHVHYDREGNVLRIENHPRPQEGGGCTCHVCGRVFKVDFDVSDELWAKIRPDKTRPPEAGLLCGLCIVDRIEGLGEFGAYEIEAKE